MSKYDFRIGNAVNYSMNGDLTLLQGTITSLGWNKAVINNDSVKYANIQPIPLTEDLLYACGCEEIEERMWLTPTVNHTRTRVRQTENGSFYSPINEHRVVILPYLHTFQNYMQVMDGQELEIKWT